MKPLIIKELRENAKWALLLCLAVAGALAWGLNTNDAEKRSLVGSTMFMITAIAFPVVGLTLGLLQALQDSSPGRWGFLTHRPISRSKIFFAKCLAGAGLYLLATGIPLTAAVYWVATPGRLAVPFDWHMILPRLADLFGGSMWYAAGLLVGERQAHWIGSRVFPGCAALVGSYLAAFLPMSIAQSILIFAVVLAILVPAAWGTFVSGGSFERQPLVTRIPSALSVGVGVVCALGACAGISDAMLHTLAAPPAAQVFTSYEIADDGQVLRVSVDRDSSLESNRVTDLQGRALPAELTKDRHVLEMAVNLQDLNPANMPWGMCRLYWGLQEEGSNLVELGATGSIQWYYVVHRRTIEGFDGIHREFIGSLGPQGFVPPTQPPEPFFEPLYILDPQLILNSPVIIAAGAETAYSINLADETVVPLFSTDPADPILNLHASVTAVYRDTAREFSPFFPYAPIIVTQTAIYVFESGAGRFRLPLTHPSPDAKRVNVCKLSDGGFGLVYQTISLDRGIWGWAVKTDPQGRIISDIELPLPPTSVPAEAWWLQMPELLIYPPIAAPVKLWLDSKSSSGFHLREFIAAGVILLAAIVGANWLLRRVGLSRPAKGFWVLLSALLGFPGVLLLFSLFNRVATVPCPSCAKRRLVTRERCEHCNAPFAAPSAGIDVFE